DDFKFGPALLHAKLLRSPHPHARIVKLDTSEAEKLPGVRAVATGKEFPFFIGLYIQDRTLYAVDRVRFVGEPVAGVAAISEDIAEEALKLIEIEYEVLEPVLNPIDGAAPTAPVIHPDLAKYSYASFIFPQPGTNFSNHFKVRKGDVDKAFEGAACVVEEKYSVPHIHHAPIENHVAVAQMDHAGKLTLWTSSQSPFAQRNLLAKALGISHKDLRVITPYVGGGFGCKAGVSIEAALLPLAMKAKGRPVKLALTRHEEFYCNFVRQGLQARIKIGVSAEGKIVAMQNTYYWDAGAYTEYGVNITRASGYSSTGPYFVPNVHADSYCVYTNHPVGGPMRGFGMPEIHWGIEQVIDTICRKMNLDPVQFRLDNAIKDGQEIVTGMKMHPTGLTKCIEEAARHIEWEKREESKKSCAAPHKKRGFGVAAMWKAPAMPPDAGSSSILKFNEDASVSLLVSGMEIGQGTLTAMAQIAAEELGIPYSTIDVQTPDTDYSPYEWQTVASRLTWSMGNAVLDAARDAKKQIFELVAEAWDTPIEHLTSKDGFVIERSGTRKIAFAHMVIYGITMPSGVLKGGPIIGRGRFIPPDVSALDQETGQGPKAVVHYTTGAQTVEIEVDEETGQIEVLRVGAAYDCGKAINPLNIKGQVIGGVAMGMGTALFEQLIIEEGVVKNASFVDYKLVSSQDMPMDISYTLVE
ncbi:MAG TPA: xanthine dehydrogenase family protein molybdopterin-binding subunit, partial [Chroococcales cyanobacterium]